MKKILYSEMNSLGTALDSFLQKDGSSLRGIMKNATLFKFWGKIVGKKFEKVSMPVSLFHKANETVLNVACASAAVTGELTLYKNQIIKKINVYANPLAINIDDINFSHKAWQAENPKSFKNTVKVLDENPYKENLNGFNPDEIELSEEEISTIKVNIEQNKLMSDEQKKRLLSSIVHDIKVHKFLNKSH